MKTFEVILVNIKDNRQEKIVQINADDAVDASIIATKNNPDWIVKSSELI